MARILFGTSGYVYASWKGIFYPPKLPTDRYLQRYSQVFKTVELNTTFYGLPRPASVQRWAEQTPEGFVFAAKGSRYLTHIKRLLEFSPGLQNFFSVVNGLGSKLQVVLWQLPPSMKEPDLPRLERFLDHLPTHVRHAFEFRSPAWHTEPVCDLLDRFGAAIVEHDLVLEPVPRPTGGFRYVRFHGTTAKYRGRYGSNKLRPVAESLLAWRDAGRDAYVYFNNDMEGHALSDALDMGELLGEPLDYQLPLEPTTAG